MPSDRIVVRGAREHNLKNLDVEMPRDRLIVITGLSGSGKSSLAFDTIYAEGQRRYVESLSAYARQFLGQMEKPDVDQIDGLSPAISIDQKGASRNPRSTVGTVTEIYDYLRLLYARIGRMHCPICGREITRQTVEQIVDQLYELPEGTRLMLMAPLVRDRKGEHEKVLAGVRAAGFVRVRVDGELRDLDEEIELDKKYKHSIEVVVDRLVVRHVDEDGTPRPDAARMADSIETAVRLSDGLLLVHLPDAARREQDRLYSERYACPEHGGSFEEPAPRNFSFNSPHGACPDCTGLGSRLEIDPELVIPDQERSLADGAVLPWRRMVITESWGAKILEAVAERYGFRMDVPFRELSPEARQIVLYGNRGERVEVRYRARNGNIHTFRTTFEGVVPNLQRRYRETGSEAIKAEIERYMTTRPCPTCNGMRLKPESLSVTVGGRNIIETTQMSVTDALAWHQALPEKLTERENQIARQVLKEIRARLGFLVDVGLEYLTLDRASGTLSGGEAQRIRLATQIGSSLMGVLYILDEPSIGLHQRDNDRLIATLLRLRDLGNTLIVVEHDEETIRSADWIIDIGPGAGEHGGRLIHSGPLEDLLRNARSITADYLRGDRYVPVPRRRRKGSGQWLTVRGARENNLRGIDVSFPLGRFIAVTGVSGSGKSSLVSQILYPALAARIWGARERPGKHDAIEGIEHIDKVIEIDQSPIGRTPRSNPATYTGLWAPLRELLAAVPEARLRGYKPGRFSFNVKGGRCEACEGAGIVQIEMHFLPDVYVTCEVCKGKRYNRETLEIHYKGRNVAEILEMTVDEALDFFSAVPAIRNKLQTLHDVGMGYIHLGQPATTLSGGEAQRVKLATELSKRATGRTFYILDEPTTGLHFEDVARLLKVLGRLVDAGNTVVVIEHNLDVIKSADWVIDLGPEGGDAGGDVVATGTPEEVARKAASHTGRYLRSALEAARATAEQRRERAAAVPA
ncbi:MAG TPA: excinuclease ABC subunit UvrA [candidate division Zixibacteria bacterium]|nr:excinuclease ABC subunit UvrA [candidate division Zixibacteria bacterium]